MGQRPSNVCQELFAVAGSGLSFGNEIVLCFSFPQDDRRLLVAGLV